MGEPIQRIIYECPDCHKHLGRDLEKAREHTSIPVDKTELPRGLVLGYETYYQAFFGAKGLSHSDHSMLHPFITLVPIGTVHDALGIVQYNRLTSTFERSFGLSYKEIRDALLKGRFRILEDNEFAKFNHDLNGEENSHLLVFFEDCKPIRTTPELEQIVLTA